MRRTSVFSTPPPNADYLEKQTFLSRGYANGKNDPTKVHDKDGMLKGMHWAYSVADAIQCICFLSLCAYFRDTVQILNLYQTGFVGSGTTVTTTGMVTYPLAIPTIYMAVSAFTQLYLALANDKRQENVSKGHNPVRTVETMLVHAMIVLVLDILVGVNTLYALILSTGCAAATPLFWDFGEQLSEKSQKLMAFGAGLIPWVAVWVVLLMQIGQNYVATSVPWFSWTLVIFTVAIQLVIAIFEVVHAFGQSEYMTKERWVQFFWFVMRAEVGWITFAALFMYY